MGSKEKLDRREIEAELVIAFVLLNFTRTSSIGVNTAQTPFIHAFTQCAHLLINLFYQGVRIA